MSGNRASRQVAKASQDGEIKEPVNNLHNLPIDSVCHPPRIALISAVYLCDYFCHLAPQVLSPTPAIAPMIEGMNAFQDRPFAVGLRVGRATEQLKGEKRELRDCSEATRLAVGLKQLPGL